MADEIPASRRYRPRAAVADDAAPNSITIDQVAALAGVSRMTVSRALNNPELVNPGTLEAVRKVIERTGYVPNMLAGGLASRRTKMVAAIVPTMSNTLFIDAIQWLTDGLSEHGYQLVIGLSRHSAEREEALVTTLLSRKPDAFFLTGVTHTPVTRQRLLNARIPVVESWDVCDSPIDMLVGFSHRAIGEGAGRFASRKRYRRIGMISASDPRAEDRFAGFREQLPRAVKTRVIHVDSHPALFNGRKGFAELIEGDFHPDFIICSSDYLALGALEEARARNIAIPDDIALMGFGGLEIAEHTVPSLTSVRLDSRRIGTVSAQLIVDRIADTTIAGRIVDIGFSIVERDSTR